MAEKQKGTKQGASARAGAAGRRKGGQPRSIRIRKEESPRATRAEEGRKKVEEGEQPQRKGVQRAGRIRLRRQERDYRRSDQAHAQRLQERIQAAMDAANKVREQIQSKIERGLHVRQQAEPQEERGRRSRTEERAPEGRREERAPEGRSQARAHPDKGGGDSTQAPRH